MFRLLSKPHDPRTLVQWHLLPVREALFVWVQSRVFYWFTQLLIVRPLSLFQVSENFLFRFPQRTVRLHSRKQTRNTILSFVGLEKNQHPRWHWFPHYADGSGQRENLWRSRREPVMRETNLSLKKHFPCFFSTLFFSLFFLSRASRLNIPPPSEVRRETFESSSS